MKQPKVLIVYKRSPLLAAGTSIATKNVRFRRNHACHYETLQKVEAILSELGLSYQKHLRNSKIKYNGFSFVITIGGDGTFLEAARKISSDQFLIGVNSDPSWSVGQFCSTDYKGLKDLLQRSLKKPKIKKLYKLRLTFLGKPKRVVECLNDILICHANPAAMSRYGICIGKNIEEHRSSGIWFSTASGSTGAIHSAGGKKLPNTSRDIQYKPRELYHGKSFSYHLKGGLIKPGKSAEIVSRMPHGRIFVDGAHIKHPFAFGRVIRLESSPNFVRVLV